MEQYFEITSNSVHYKEYFDYVDKFDKERNEIKKFKEKHNITGDGYMIWKDYLWVMANQENVKNFGSQFKDEIIHGCRPFKKTSEIGKSFKESGIKRADKPFVPFFFPNAEGKTRTRLFNVENKVYCSIETPYDEKLGAPKGFIEMKASRFFEIIETAEEKAEKCG